MKSCPECDFEWNSHRSDCQYAILGDRYKARCPHGCRGEMWWVDTNWYCKVCGDEWDPHDIIVKV